MEIVLETFVVVSRWVVATRVSMAVMVAGCLRSGTAQ